MVPNLFDMQVNELALNLAMFDEDAEEDTGTNEWIALDEAARGFFERVYPDER